MAAYMIGREGMLHHRVFSRIVAVMAAAVLIGCMSFVLYWNGTVRAAITVMTYEQVGDGYELMSAEGTLALMDMCLVLETQEWIAESGGVGLVVWPDDQVSVTARGDISLFGKEYALGDHVALDGSYGWLWAYGPGSDYYKLHGGLVPSGCEQAALISDGRFFFAVTMVVD